MQIKVTVEFWIGTNRVLEIAVCANCIAWEINGWVLNIICYTMLLQKGIIEVSLWCFLDRGSGLLFSSTKKCSSGDWYTKLPVWRGKPESFRVIFCLLFSRGLLQKVLCEGSVPASLNRKFHKQTMRFHVPEPLIPNLNCHLNKTANWLKCILEHEIHFFFQTIYIYSV